MSIPKEYCDHPLRIHEIIHQRLTKTSAFIEPTMVDCEGSLWISVDESREFERLSVDGCGPRISRFSSAGHTSVCAIQRSTCARVDKDHRISGIHVAASLTTLSPCEQL